MDSISTLHARVAALSRYRRPDDPELVESRRLLKQCTEDAESLRARIRTCPPSEWTLAVSVGEAASV